MLINSRPRDWLAAGPVAVFHHVPKCGGTSVRNGLARWFIPVLDYASPGGSAHARVDPAALRARHVLCGHFAAAETSLAARYPEILQDPGRYRVFTFLRDPLTHRVSHYFHVRKVETRPLPPLETWLTDFGPNLLAGSLGCNERDWREILARYCFVGMLEDLQGSFDRLAQVLGRRPIRLPRINQSEESARIATIPPELKRRFRSDNALDYRIYESVSTRSGAGSGPG